jgi:hypothetical protein
MTATMNATPQPLVRSYAECSNQSVSAANGVDYAFRELGNGGAPRALLQHFRGNVDYWDPALIDALAARRRVILFHNAGVGKRKSVPGSPAGGSAFRPGKPARISSPVTIARPAV